MSGNEISLIDVKALVPATVFAEGGIEGLLSSVEKQARDAATKLDASTPKGRKEIKSLAYKVSQSKTALEAMGDGLKADAKKIVDGVNKDLREVRTRFDNLRDEIKKPVDDFEAREEKRTDTHKEGIREIEALARFDQEPDEATVAARIETLDDLATSDFEEFAQRANAAIEQTSQTLNAHAIAAKARRIEREEAEALALKQAEEERIAEEKERIAREEEIARLAAEQARIESERRASEEAERVKRLVAENEARIEREKQEAIDRAAKAESDRIAAEQKAEKDRIAAQQRAEEEKQAAVEAERQRIADAQAKLKREEEARARNIAHKAKINREVLEALKAVGLSEGDGKSVITAIVTQQIPHVTLTY